MASKIAHPICAAVDAACEAGKGGLLPWQQLQAWLPIQGPPREEAVRTAVHDILVHLHGMAWSFLHELVFLNFQREGSQYTCNPTSRRGVWHIQGNVPSLTGSTEALKASNTKV